MISMNSIKSRINALEKNQADCPPTEQEQRRRLDELYAREGLDREQVISKYGSEPAYAYHRMCNGPADDHIDIQRTAEQRYMEMISH